MNRRDFLKNVGFGAALAAFGRLDNLFAETAINKPNIVFILTDDLGCHDVGFMNSKYYETPNIDKIAQQGMIFDNAYTCGPNCAPTRASLMSGQYTPRHNILSVGGSDKAPLNLMKLLTDPIDTTLKSNVITIAESLKPAGYTSASIGKWHLGSDPLLGPKGQGFDINIAGGEYGQVVDGRYFSPYHNPMISDGPDGEYLTDRLTNEAIAFINTNKNKPFFLYLPHYAVHVPLKAKNALINKYTSKIPAADQDVYKPTYAAMIESLDQGVGKVLDKLDELQLTNKTIVFFTSDNGGYKGATSNAPLRGYKGQLYEGGVRVPLAAKWPGVITAGTRCAEPVISVDFFPTFVELAAAGLPKNGRSLLTNKAAAITVSSANSGAAMPKGQVFDGKSILPLLKGQNTFSRDAIYWHFPCYVDDPLTNPVSIRQAPAGSMRKGNFKLIEFFEDNHLELYNLQDDPYEQNDLVALMPAKAEELRQQLVAWRQSTGAKVPTMLNPAYDPSASQVAFLKSQDPINDD